MYVYVVTPKYMKFDVEARSYKISLLTTIVFVTAVVTIKRAVTALVVPHTAAS